jgi:hypothetical protein
MSSRRGLVVTSVALVVECVGGMGCHATPSEKPSERDASARVVPAAPMNVTPLPAASVAAYVNPSHLPPYTGPTGSVEGTVRVDGPPSPEMKGVDVSTCPGAARMYAKLFREGPPQTDGSRALADAVVAVTGYSGFYVPETNESASLHIVNCAFDTRTIAMTFGQRLDVQNDDADLWAPSLAQSPAPVLMMATSHGDPVRMYPPHPGYFTIIDKEKHPWAQADAYVLLHPLHDVTNVVGHYRIDGVPVGKMKVSARLRVLQHEATAETEVLENVVKTVDLLIHYTPTAERIGDGGAPPKVIP